MKFGQIVIGINLLIDHQASGAPINVPSVIGNYVRSDGCASQPVLGSNGVVWSLADQRLHRKMLEAKQIQAKTHADYGVPPSNDIKHHIGIGSQDAQYSGSGYVEAPGVISDGAGPTTDKNHQIDVSWEDLDEIVIPFNAPFHSEFGVTWKDMHPNHFDSGPTKAPGISPHKTMIPPQTSIKTQISIGKQHPDQNYLASGSAEAPGIKTGELFPNTKITEQIGVAHQDMGQGYFLPFEPAKSPETSNKEDLGGSDHEGSDHDWLSPFTPVQWAEVGASIISLAGVGTAASYLGWWAYQRYVKKLNIPFFPWNFPKSKVQDQIFLSQNSQS